MTTIASEPFPFDKSHPDAVIERSHIQAVLVLSDSPKSDSHYSDLNHCSGQDLECSSLEKDCRAAHCTEAEKVCSRSCPTDSHSALTDNVAPHRSHLVSHILRYRRHFRFVDGLQRTMGLIVRKWQKLRTGFSFCFSFSGLFNHPGSNQRKTTNDCESCEVFYSGSKQDLLGAKRCCVPSVQIYFAALRRLLLGPSKPPSVANLKFRLYAGSGCGKSPRLVPGFKSPRSSFPETHVSCLRPDVVYCQPISTVAPDSIGHKKSAPLMGNLGRSPEARKNDSGTSPMDKFYALLDLMSIPIQALFATQKTQGGYTDETHRN
jgi:hypothetical protein